MNKYKVGQTVCSHLQTTDRGIVLEVREFLPGLFQYRVNWYRNPDSEYWYNENMLLPAELTKTA